MSNAFNLHPNIALLTKYGYEFFPTLDVDAIWESEKRVKVEEAFRALTEKYNLIDQYDTLLYICLVESNIADIQFQNVHSSYSQYLRIKELAQLLLLYKPSEKHKPTVLKIASVTTTVKVTDSFLIDWIGTLIKDTIQAQEFPLTDFGQALVRLTLDDNGSMVPEAQLNWNTIQHLANQKRKKPGIQERNKYLVKFLLKVLQFLNNETILTTEPGVRFTDNQLNFLFKVAEILDWIREDDFESEPKDYIYTLLHNRLS